VDVNKLDGTARGEAHLSQTIVLRAGTESRVAWIKGVVAPYDPCRHPLSHLADEAHYLGALEIATGAPAVQWSILFGTGTSYLRDPRRSRRASTDSGPRRPAACSR